MEEEKNQEEKQKDSEKLAEERKKELEERLENPEEQEKPAENEESISTGSFVSDFPATSRLAEATASECRQKWSWYWRSNESPWNISSTEADKTRLRTASIPIITTACLTVSISRGKP